MLSKIWPTKPLTLGIYYTNRSLLSTIIWPQFATKLCFFPVFEKIALGFALRPELSLRFRSGLAAGVGTKARLDGSELPFWVRDP